MSNLLECTKIFKLIWKTKNLEKKDKKHVYINEISYVFVSIYAHICKRACKCIIFIQMKISRIKTLKANKKNKNEITFIKVSFDSIM